MVTVTSLVQLKSMDLPRLLAEWQIKDTSQEAIKTYVKERLDPIKLALETLPATKGHVLQLGASPFFLSTLLHQFTELDLEYAVHSLARQDIESGHQIAVSLSGKESWLSYTQLDLESTRLPYDDGTFDGVLMVDLLHKLGSDPIFVLSEAHRVLKQDGWLLIVSPNATTTKKMANIWIAKNNARPLSHQETTDRDVRQYTLPEISDLFTVLHGFNIDLLKTQNVIGDSLTGFRQKTFGSMVRLLKRQRLHEEYLLLHASKRKKFHMIYPKWLFTSYDPFTASPTEPLSRADLRLPGQHLEKSRFPRRLCKVCDARDWYGDDWLGLLAGMGENPSPDYKHRKAWEWAQGIYALQQLNMLHEDATAIGVGAGTEQVLFYLANRIGMVYATDIYGEGGFAGQTAQADMLNQPDHFAQIPFPKEKLKTMYMDGTRLEFPSDHFDIAFSFSSIEHFGGHEAARKAMLEMGRVVKPGGVVVVTTELVVNGASHHQFFRPDELYRHLIRDTGLRLVEDIDFTLSDETLAHPVDMGRPDFHFVQPHILLKLGKLYWTSVIIVLVKAESD